MLRRLILRFLAARVGVISLAEHSAALTSLNLECNRAMAAAWNALAREEQHRREAEAVAKDWEALAVAAQRELEHLARKRRAA